MKKINKQLLASVAFLALAHESFAATAQGTVVAVTGVATSVQVAIPIFAGLAGAILGVYFFILLNKKADEQRGQDVTMTKLILTGLAAGGLLAWSTSQGIFSSLIA